eukprot:CAMPEP_0181351414 /NCGR_PEP_ID=MMETSP1106-20121128/1775_1 /TAXON_ID=81844 /ORGANISM="Mantoniella antarctica, Strain SL-175" /LENGTH=39 /DNA_ID= /DNA_START= /DNA_END= /DNA_ORIENTATION=
MCTGRRDRPRRGFTASQRRNSVGSMGPGAHRGDPHVAAT